MSSPLATVKCEEKSLVQTPAQMKALDALEGAKDRVVTMLRDGVPAFGAAVDKLLADGKLTKAAGELMTSELGAIAKLSPKLMLAQFSTSHFDGKMTEQQAAALVKRGGSALVLLKGKMLSQSARGEANVKTLGRAAAAETAQRGSGADALAKSDGAAAAARRADAGASEARVVEKSPSGARSAGESKLGAGRPELTTVALDDAIYKEAYSKFDTVDKLMALARRANELSTTLEARSAAGEDLSDRDTSLMTGAGELVFDARAYLQDAKNYSGNDFSSFFEGVEHTDADIEAFVKAMAGTKQSTQTANLGTGRQATKDEQAAAKQHILDTLGSSVKGAFVKHFGDNSSGSWTPGATINTIRLALNGDVLSTAYHESMHEFFGQLGQAGSSATQAMLKRVATNGILNRKIERLLADHPAAAAQVRNDPEEAVAFMYQFWRAGGIKARRFIAASFDRYRSELLGLL